MLASSFAKLKDYDSDELAAKVQNDYSMKQDISRSLMTMLTVNTLLFAKQITQIEKIKNVVWVGTHVDILPYQ